MFKAISVFFFSLSLVIVLPEVSSLVAYDCNNPKSKVAEVSLIDTETCTPTKKNISTKATVIQLIQPQVFDEIPYKQCLVEIQHLLTRCGASIDTHQKGGYYDELYAVTERECEEMIRDRVFVYSGIRIILNKKDDLSIVSTETIGSISDGSCSPGPTSIINGVTYTRPLRTSKFRIMIRKGKGTVDLEESKFITEDGSRCNYQDETCLTASGGHTFWKIPFDDKYCGMSKFIPIYQGPATRVIETVKSKEVVSYILHYEDYDFQLILTGNKRITCGSVSLLTEHPKLSIIEMNDNLPFNLKYNPRTLGKNINMMTYVNSKLVYTMKHIKEQIESLYDDLSYSRCLTENKIIQSILASAASSPHDFAYQFYGSEGYTATVRGEVAYIMECEPISVNYTSNSNGECYNEIPVTKNGQQMFVLPRGRLLTSIGTKIECSNILPVKYKLQEAWYVVGPSGLIPTSNPEKMMITQSNPWEFKDISNFASVGIYSQEDLDKLEKIMLSPVRSDAITHQIARAISGESTLDQGLRLTHMMTPEELSEYGKSKFNMFLDMVLRKLGVFGNIISSIIGIIIILKGFLFIINSFISLKVMKDMFGCSWKLLFFWWDYMVHLLMRGENKVYEKNHRTKRSIVPSAPIETLTFADFYKDSLEDSNQRTCV